MGDTHPGDAQNAHGVRVWEVDKTWNSALAGRSKSQRYTWTSSNDVMSAQVSRCVHRRGAPEREPQSLHGRGQGRAPESTDVGSSEWVGRVEGMRSCMCKGLEL